LKSTWEWLKHNVLELIKEVEIKTDKFVSGLEDKAHAAILIFELAAGRIVEAVRSPTRGADQAEHLPPGASAVIGAQAPGIM
jgi:hypothetical protein